MTQPTAPQFDADQPDTSLPPIPETEVELDLSGFAPEDFELDPDAVDLPDVSDVLPPAPPELPFGQDEEGLGAAGDIEAFVRPWPEALAIVIGYIKTGKTVTPGYCLRETREYYNVAAKYLAAKDSLAGAIALGVAHKVTLTEEAVKRIPRGTIVYWRRFSGGVVSGYGHIAPSFGGGFTGSTDWPTGRYGRVNILTLARAWGYTEIWWAPVVNDTRVWKPKGPKPAPTPLIDRFFASDDTDERGRILVRLAADGDGDRPEQVKRAAARVLAGRADVEKAHELRARADKRITAGRQALRALTD